MVESTLRKINHCDNCISVEDSCQKVNKHESFSANAIHSSVSIYFHLAFFVTESVVF